MAVHADTAWSVPPVDYFLCERPPNVVIGIVPFLDVADTKLEVESGASPLSFLI